ncbi:MAG: hypothetical protein L3J84_07115 [Gammaproteobacteria bacterium]|nr:hypothetical protein [Gammaproteobacteria bacterium]
MPSFKRSSLAIFVVLYLFACAGIQPDSEAMVNRLLHIDNKKFISKTESGETFYNSLSEFKEWESLYIKYSKYGAEEQHLTNDELKKLLFIAFIARANSDAAISESFASDLVPIYDQNSGQVLTVLSELKFLVPATCYYFNKYFGFEGKNAEQKGEWLKRNESRLVSNLGQADGEICLAFFK